MRRWQLTGPTAPVNRGSSEGRASRLCLRQNRVSKLNEPVKSFSINKNFRSSRYITENRPLKYAIPLFF